MNNELIYDWNEVGRRHPPFGPVEFFDETLRDGLQNPSVKDPSITEKLELIHLMESLGIHAADIGLPGSSKRAFDDVLRMCQEIVSSGMKLRPACAGRTVAADILPMVEISQKAGIPVEVYTFIGSSPIRLFAESWDVDTLLKHSADAIDVAVKNNLPVAYVTEDTIRSRPEVLAALFKNAIDHGASRLVLCDTVGHATPDGTRNLIRFTQNLLKAYGAHHVKLDFHNHNDRGLGLVNALTAVEEGIDRVHGTALGIGERVGNTAMELILLNLKLAGALEHQDMTNLIRYCELTSKAVGMPVPVNYPLVGADAFRTSTGVHAAAIIKAQNKGDDELADRIYSGVPAGMFGRGQTIEIGPMSGASNVVFWLKGHAIESDPGLVQAILLKAKEGGRVLAPDEVLAAVSAHRAAATG
ncbi:MAG: 2-isopropylmalate synthase [Deltaproteobacteria bacterium]|jgi:2-isopropylmalate synthase|nr:2-isopropylmalate synthase [Deltaproteobacteria bacterium]MBP6831203.1 2-isopropylmalate synthase [Deltaproteobacteria bacterium]